MKGKKILLWLLIPLTFFSILTGGIIYKSINPYKPTIYNYQSYVNPDLIPKIEENYSYREYKNNYEFNNAINNNKAIAGISTDYMIIDLINNNKISKIDFEGAFEINDPRSFYSDQTIKQLDYFDKYIGVNSEGDIDGDGVADKFWEYIIPIWLNNKVFVYNSNKINHNIPDFNNDFSYTNILEKLTQKGADVWSWTNAPIENSVIGSEISSDGFNTTLTLENYVQRIDEFANIVKTGTGHEISDGIVNIFEDDSDVVLQSVIDSKSSIKGAYLFNGDALDAHWSEDNFSNVLDGTVKLVRPKNSPSFIDGFVVSSSISSEKQTELLKNMNDVFFKGKFMTKDEINKSVRGVDGIIAWDKIASLNNFDYVNYTPTSKGEYDFILENYFQDEENPNIVKKFYEINIDQIIPISPLNQELQSKIVSEFKRRLRL